MAAGKPAPDVYQEAVDRLGARSPGSLAVEDSSNGIRAAAAAGLRVLGMEHPQYPIDRMRRVAPSASITHSTR